MKRREQRESIIRLVFRIPFCGEGEMQDQTDFYLAQMEEQDADILPEDCAGFVPRDGDYIREQVAGILEKLPDIDREIQVKSRGWQIGRFGKAELAILRVAVYELLYDSDIPPRVAVNEAVEMAKKYCDEKAAPFINGVLSGFVKQAEDIEEKAE